MRKLGLALLTILGLVWPLCAQSDGPANTPQETVTVGDASRSYYIHVPPTYDPHGHAPLLLVFSNLYEDGGFAAYLTGFNALADKQGMVVVYPNPTGGGWDLGIEHAGEGSPTGRRYGRRGGFGFPRGGGYPGGGYPGGGYPGGGGGYPDGGGGGGYPPAGDQTQARPERPQDLAFVDALLGQVERTYQIDASRVYAVGIGDGGFMAMRVGCQRSGQIAAIATVGATLPKSLGTTCLPIRPVALLMYMGTKDPLVPYNGGTSKLGYSVLSADATAKLWSKVDNCAPKPSTSKAKQAGAEIKTTDYDGCARGSAVELQSISNMGNTWPGTTQYEPEERFGKGSPAPKATDQMWQFLMRFSLPPGS